MTDYLRPKVRTGNLSTRRMEDGIFRNPPTYTALGGFTSERKLIRPAIATRPAPRRSSAAARRRSEASRSKP